MATPENIRTDDPAKTLGEALKASKKVEDNAREVARTEQEKRAADEETETEQ